MTIFCNIFLIQLSFGLSMIMIIILGKIFMYFDNKYCNHTFNQDDVMNLKIEPKCVKCGKDINQCKKSS
jgi:hypothetical protein